MRLGVGDLHPRLLLGDVRIVDGVDRVLHTLRRPGLETLSCLGRPGGSVPGALPRMPHAHHGRRSLALGLLDAGLSERQPALQNVQPLRHATVLSLWVLLNVLERPLDDGGRLEHLFPHEQGEHQRGSVDGRAPDVHDRINPDLLASTTDVASDLRQQRPVARQDHRRVCHVPVAAQQQYPTQRL